MYHFRDQILSGNPQLFFVMNCDVCGDFPLLDMLEFHKAKGADGAHFTLLATEVNHEHLFIKSGAKSLMFYASNPNPVIVAIMCKTTMQSVRKMQVSSHNSIFSRQV